MNETEKIKFLIVFIFFHLDIFSNKDFFLAFNRQKIKSYYSGKSGTDKRRKREKKVKIWSKPVLPTFKTFNGFNPA